MDRNFEHRVWERGQEPKEKQIKPYTEAQVKKLCREASIDMTNDGIEVDASTAYDVAGSLIMDPRVEAFLIRKHVIRKLWQEYLADYF